MKYTRKFNKVFLALVLILAIGSCTKDFEEMNTSPNSPVDVPAINILTNVIVNGMNRELGGWIQHTYLGCWCQQWTKVQYIDEDRYQIRDMSGDSEGPYNSQLVDLQIILDKTTEDIEAGEEVVNNTLLKGAALVLQSWIFHYVTDLVGDTPYSEALQGLYTDGTITPVYDTQESIYMALLARLEEANQLLATSTVNFGSGDILNGGNPVMWRKLANSLKLRILNRCAGTPWSFTYDMADPQADVTTNPGPAAYAGADAAIGTILGDPATYPVMTSNADNADLTYPGLPYRNPIYNTLYSRTDQGIAETMVEWLKARSDPRLAIYAQPTPNSVAAGTPDYVGLQNGWWEAAANFPSISLLGLDIAYDENAPTFLMCVDEVEFIKAEYYKRQGNDVAAQAAYENGIALSMARWGATYDKATYYDGVASVDYTLAADDGEIYQRILEQKWAAMYGQGVQAFAEVRRTGFPARVFEYELSAAYFPNMGLPIRIHYSYNEATYNSANLDAAKTRQNVEETNYGMFSTSGTSSQLWWHTRKNPIPTEFDY